MDASRFDDLTCALVLDARSRRSLVKVVAGGVLAAALGRLGLAEAAAACGRVGAKCDGTSACCRGAICKKGRCRCATGRKDCDGDGRCEADVRTDPINCGDCGNRCGVFKVCQDGRCLCEPGRTPCGINCCIQGATCCNDRCADLTDDPDNCGACGNRCGDGRLCQGGSCCVPRGGACADSLDCCNAEGLDICVRGVCGTLPKPTPKPQPG